MVEATMENFKLKQRVKQHSFSFTGATHLKTRLSHVIRANLKCCECVAFVLITFMAVFNLNFFSFISSHLPKSH